MLQILCLTVFLACIAVGSGQGAFHCESPLNFEASVLQTDRLTKFYRRGRMFYDGIGERVRYIEETAVNQTKPAEDILILFRERKEYVVDVATRKCEHSTPRHEFHRIGVSADFRLVSEYSIGAPPGDGVEIGVYERHENTTEQIGVTLAQFTRRDCLPFVYEFEGMANKEKVDYHRVYSDIHLGEVKPEMFAVPKECASRFADTIL